MEIHGRRPTRQDTTNSTNFKSFVAGVTDTDGIHRMLHNALFHQHMFETRTTPWEAACWTKSDLKHVKIMARDIDRLYHIFHESEHDDPDPDAFVFGETFELVARMRYRGQPLYVDMKASCDFTGFDCRGGGYVLVSRDVDNFMNSIKSDHARVIHGSLSWESSNHTPPAGPRPRRRHRRRRRHRHPHRRHGGGGGRI